MQYHGRINMVEAKSYGSMDNEERLQYLYKRYNEIDKESKDLNKRKDDLEIRYKNLDEKRKNRSLGIEILDQISVEINKILDEKSDISSLILNRKSEKISLNGKIRREERIKLEIEEVDKFNSWIDGFVSSGYPGLISINAFDFYFNPLSKYVNICDARDDLRKVNINQYMVISDDDDIEEVKFDFDIIEPNELFYRKDGSFKNKKQLIEFLDKAEKIYLNSDMCFIPYTYKQDKGFYLLVINNTLQNIEDYQLKSLNFLNKQHNIYYIIDTNRDDQFKDLNQLKNYILKTCQKYVNPNRDLLYSVYPKVDNFKKDKGIVRQYS